MDNEEINSYLKNLMGSDSNNDRRIFNDLLMHFQLITNMFLVKVFLDSHESEDRENLLNYFIEHWKENLETNISIGLQKHELTEKVMKTFAEKYGIDPGITSATEIHQIMDENLASVEQVIRSVLSPSLLTEPCEEYEDEEENEEYNEEDDGFDEFSG